MDMATQATLAPAQPAAPETDNPLAVMFAPGGTRDFAEKFKAFESAVKAGPPITISYRHFFLPGMVLRQMFAPAGAAITGWVHKRDSFAVVSSGRIAVANQDGQALLVAGDAFICRAGTQNIGWALEDTTYLNVWRTELTEGDDEAVRHDVAVPSVEDYQRYLLEAFPCR